MKENEITNTKVFLLLQLISVPCGQAMLNQTTCRRWWTTIWFVKAQPKYNWINTCDIQNAQNYNAWLTKVDRNGNVYCPVMPGKTLCTHLEYKRRAYRTSIHALWSRRKVMSTISNTALCSVSLSVVSKFSYSPHGVGKLKEHGLQNCWGKFKKQSIPSVKRI